MMLVRSISRFLYTLGHSVIVRLLFAGSSIVATLGYIFMGCVLILIGVIGGGAILSTVFPSLEAPVTFLAEHIYWLFGIFTVWVILMTGVAQNVFAAFTASGDSLARRIAVTNYAAEVAMSGKQRYAKGQPATYTALRREAIPHYVKAAVYSRDAGVCQHCGGMYDLEYDHVIPLSKGGSNGANNIQLLCRPCNLRKGNRYAY